MCRSNPRPTGCDVGGFEMLKVESLISDVPQDFVPANAEIIVNFDPETGGIGHLFH